MRRSLFLCLLVAGCSPPAPDDPLPTDIGVPRTDCDVDVPDATVGLRRCTDEAEAGYALFTPFADPTTYLLDPHGEVVHRWAGQRLSGMSTYLLDDGTLLRATNLPPSSSFVDGMSRGGGLEARSWDGALLWETTFADDTVFRHHDVEPLPDGTVLVIAYEYKTRAEALAVGRDPDLLVGDALWPDFLLRYDPAADEVVWEWHLWDHLIQDRDPTLPNYGSVAENPGRVDINAVTFETPGSDGADWNHMNSVSWDPVRDEILMTSHAQGEIWVIDADGDSDLQWRWGKDPLFDGPADGVLVGPHDAHRIPEGLPGAGDVLVFDNNGGDDGRSVLRQVAPAMAGDDYARQGAAWAPAEEVWTYEAEGFASFFASGLQRLRSGNTWVTEAATGRMFEITASGDVVWEYVNPVTMDGILADGEVPVPQANALFKTVKLRPGHPALVDRELVSQGPLVE